MISVGLALAHPNYSLCTSIIAMASRYDQHGMNWCLMVVLQIIVHVMLLMCPRVLGLLHAHVDQSINEHAVVVWIVL